MSCPVANRDALIYHVSDNMIMKCSNAEITPPGVQRTRKHVIAYPG